MRPQKIRLGTRSSPLALWQAKQVSNLIQNYGIDIEIIPVNSDGDKNLTQPIYDMGITGVFTKTLDQSLIDGNIDLAVHSLKDVPTQTAKGISILAVLKRDSPFDILIHKKKLSNLDFKGAMVIGTGSIRRSAFWKNRYPNHTTENLRGNIQSRLKKIDQYSHWEGGIFAQAAIERLRIKQYYLTPLEWMTPAPGQGIIAICGMESNHVTLDITKKINDKDSALCMQIERDFMKMVEGGCSKPIGAYAQIKKDKICFQWSILSEDGIEHKRNQIEVSIDQVNVGKEEATHYLNSL